MRRALLRLLIPALGLLLLASLPAYTHLYYSGNYLHWSSSGMVWHWDSAGSADVSDDSEYYAVKRAFQSWQDIAESNALFVQQQVGAYNGIGSSSTHWVTFDENNSTGYFPGGSSIVAITPLTFYLSNGVIIDADIVFNGKNYKFSTKGTAGTYDIQDVATHEIGHFLGLDHSGLVGSSMFPYVAPVQWIHRSPSTDDAAGAADIYPKGITGQISGTVQRGDGSSISGAHIVAFDADGRMYASALTKGDGVFAMKGLPAGTYRLLADPLEGAVSQSNVGGDHTVQTDFGTTVLGGLTNPQALVVSAGSTTDIGVFTTGANNSLIEGQSSVKTVSPGSGVTVTVFGTGFTPGAMSASTLSDKVTVTQTVSGSTWVQASVEVAADAPLGLYGLVLQGPSGGLASASGVIDVVLPSPTLIGVSPSHAETSGGETVILSGTNFADGAVALFGGVTATATTWLDGNTLQVIVPANEPGPCQVTVINPDGQENGLGSAFAYTADPAITGIFPSAGQTSGGTTLLVGGNWFASDSVVYLDGQPAATTFLSARALKVTTPMHAEGAVELRVEAAGQPTAISPTPFTFVNSPDPSISDFNPRSGSETGGVIVGVSGSGFLAGAKVKFGADAENGLGGIVAATAVNSENALDATAPAHAPGTYAIVVELPSGQGAMASSTFTYTASPSVTTGGGGGCGFSRGAGAARGAWGDFGMLAASALGAIYLRRRSQPDPVRVAR